MTYTHTKGMPTVLEYLKLCALDGALCLHGSKRMQDVLEPRQAHCNSGSDANCQHAVYASPDHIDVAIVIALFDKKPGAHSCTTSYSRHGKDKLVVRGDEGATFSPGYVHVVPTASFGWYDNEFISREPVGVLAAFRVEPSILRVLDTIDLQIPIPPPY